MIEIVSAQTGQQLEGFIQLAHEYVTWMVGEVQTHYKQLDVPAFIAAHDYDDLHKKYPGEHVPPYGCLRIALQGKQVAGCIALGRLSESICEVRTLFVRPEFRGKGIGHLCVAHVLSEAQNLGYRQARLDTLGFMSGAQHLYRSFGFHDIEPYGAISESLRPYIRFLERDLDGSMQKTD